MRLRLIAAVAVVLIVSTAAEADPRPSPMEPPEGTMQPGQSVLVDDGTCPTGQIKKVISGNMTTNARLRSCIPRH